MSFLIGEISARVSADTSRFDSSISGVKRKGEQASRDLIQSFDKVGRGMRKTGAIMTASLTVPMVMGMRKAVQESALLEGALAKFDVVFGDMAQETRAWVEEFRSGVPLSRREIVQSAGALQDLLVPMGIAREEATGMTKDWMQLAAALSAFNDVPVGRALEAIRGGIAGEAEALRRFGIDVRVAAVEQRALSMGLIEAGEEMSEQVRQQALLAQAYANSKDAVDGYEDQLGTTLLTQQEMNATWKDTLAVIGSDLEPLYKSLMSSVTELMDSFNELDSTTRTNMITMSLYVAAAGPVIAILGQLLIWSARLNKSMKALNITMSLNPWVAAGIGIAALGTAAYLTNERINSLNDSVEDALNADIETQSLEALNQVIVDIENRIKEISKEAITSGVGAGTLEEVTRLQEELDKVIDRRDQLAKQEHDSAWAKEITDELIKASNALNDFVNADFSKLKNWDTKAKETVARIKDIREEALDPIDIIIGFSADPGDTFESINAMIEESIRNSSTFDFSEKLFPEGSLGALQNRLSELRESFSYAFNPEEQERLRNEIKLTEEQIEKLKGSSQQGGQAIMGLTNTIGTMFERAVLHGNDLQSVLKGIAKQLAAKAFVTGLGAILTGGASLGKKSFLSNVFGGFFASGGNPPTGKMSVVGERGPELIAPRSASTVIPNHQLGGGVDPRAIGRAVGHELDKRIRAVDSETIYALAQKGKYSY